MAPVKNRLVIRHIDCCVQLLVWILLGCPLLWAFSTKRATLTKLQCKTLPVIDNRRRTWHPHPYTRREGRGHDGRLFLSVITSSNGDNADETLDLLNRLQSVAASAASDNPTAVGRAEALFLQWQAKARQRGSSSASPGVYLLVYNVLLKMYATIPPPSHKNEDDNDDECLTRLTELLASMVDRDDAPAPNDESYAWLLEAYIQRQDWEAARQTWQALVDFEAQQPAWKLTTRLREQYHRIPSLEMPHPTIHVNDP